MFEPVTSSRTVERVSAYASGTREPPPRTPDWAKRFPRDWARLSVGAGVLSAERANRAKNTSQFGKALRALEPAVAWLGTPGLLTRALSSDHFADTHFTEPLTPAAKPAAANGHVDLAA
ncbi:MAG: hypothetical protein SFY95_08965 [Planctomycetota bacterium]|nr:hypothetical protein [Planctomycetota bacterium]